MFRIGQSMTSLLFVISRRIFTWNDASGTYAFAP